jgi:cyclopropane fatty-acyl-phospholipid synthase-like methyltransferase
MLVNSKEYWDMLYKDEIEKNITRADPDRWAAIMSQINDKDKVLEFGSGLGEFIEFCVKHKPFCSYTGIDTSPVAIDYCRKRMPNFDWIEKDQLIQPLCDKDFVDVIIAQHVLEHMTEEKQIQFFDNSYNLLAKGGRLIVVFPINDSPWREHLKVWQLNDIADLVRTKKKEWKSFAWWRPQTRYNRTDGYNDNDFEEAIIFMIKK